MIEQNQNNYTIGWYLRKTLNKKTGLFPIQLQLYVDGKQYSRLSVKLYSTENDFEKVMGRRGENHVKELRKKLDDLKNKAMEILDSMINFDFKIFQAQFFGEAKIKRTKDKKLLSDVFDQHVEEYKKQGKSVKVYELAKNSFLKFSNEELLFEQTTSDWMYRYVAWYEKKTGSDTTAFTYLRHLRVIWNDTIKKGFKHPKYYPFKNFHMKDPIRKKTALVIEDVEKLYYYKPKTTLEQKAIDYWFFCYLGNGMNPNDMLRLKWKDIKKDRIVFVRRKTRHNSNLRSIEVSLSDPIKKIIDKYSKRNNESNRYVFPELNECFNSSESVEKKITSTKNYLNKRLRRIGKNLNLPETLNLGISRHSFATTLYYSGNKQFATEMMGHSNSIVTEHYFKSLQIDQIKDVSDCLLAFTKTK